MTDLTAFASISHTASALPSACLT